MADGEKIFDAHHVLLRPNICSGNGPDQTSRWDEAFVGCDGFMHVQEGLRGEGLMHVATRLRQRCWVG